MKDDKEKALSAALAQIERQFGKGSIMKLGDNNTMDVFCAIKRLFERVGVCYL